MQTISLSPSFSSYSNSKLAEIAVRVVDDFDSDEFPGKFYRENSAAQDEEEFEFATAARNSELSSLTSADEIFDNFKIRPVYPVFDRDLLLGNVKFHNENENVGRNSVSPAKIRLPLRKLFIEERGTTITMSSDSSSESDDVDGVTAESYCEWPPKAAEAAAEGNCKTSSSTGNSKRWKLRDFLRRSNSDGSKNSFVVLSHSNSGRKKEIEKKVAETAADGGGVKSAEPPPPPLPPCNRSGGAKQLSYLPYREGLVGFFGNVNGLRKKLPSY